MYARVSSTRSSVLVVLLGNAQQYYLFRWGEVIIHLKLEKVAPSTFFFFFLFGESIYHPPLILMKGKATPPVLYPPTSPKVSGRLDARSKISTFSHHLFPGGDACSNTFRVPFLFAVCVCVCGYQIIGVADSSPRRMAGFGCSQFFSDSTDAIDPLCHRVFPTTHMDRDKKK